MTKAAQTPQEPVQEPVEAPEVQAPPETPETPENGTSEPTEGKPDERTDLERHADDDAELGRAKGATFAEAIEQQDQDQDDAVVDPNQVTRTAQLEAEGKSKGATFAEQAAKARELYGTGNPTTKD